MHNDGSLIAAIALLGFFAFILFVIGVVLYILASLGLYRLASNQGIDNPWLAWIPVANLYILGKIIKNLRISSLEIPSIELVLPIGWLSVIILGDIRFIGSLLNLVYVILFFCAIYKLYKMYRPEKAVLWLVLSIILPFMCPIFIYRMRNDNIANNFYT